MAVRVRVPLAALSFKFFIMKKFAYTIFLLASLILTSCGVGSGHFKFEGKFLNMNQGEFYVYSPDGGFDGIDTIKVEGGRFTFECPCKDQFTIMVVFPNFSEQPIFAESGASVDIKADASHLKELSVKGTKDNELMTTFRESILNVAPPEEKIKAENFIKDHIKSVVSVFLTKKYFIASTNPDYKKAYALLEELAKAQPGNGQIQRLLNQIKTLKDQSGKLPNFTAYDTNGKLISSAELSSIPVAVITTWASYNYDSQEVQRELKRRLRDAKGKLKILGICIDASKEDCKRSMERDSISWSNICNGDMLEDKTLQKLGLTSIPDNIILQNGTVVGRSLRKQELYDKLTQLLR